MTYFDENQQPGAFPGMDFFAGLTELAKKTTEDIAAIEHDLSSSKHSAPLDETKGINSWTQELQEGVEKCKIETKNLQELWEHEPDLERTREVFETTFEWLKRETDRIEKQLTKFGYTPCPTEIYHFNYRSRKETSSASSPRSDSPQSTKSSPDKKNDSPQTHTDETCSQPQQQPMDVDSDDEANEAKHDEAPPAEIPEPTPIAPTPIKPRKETVPPTPTLGDYGLEKYMNWHAPTTSSTLGGFNPPTVADISFSMGEELTRKYGSFSTNLEPPSIRFGSSVDGQNDENTFSQSEFAHQTTSTEELSQGFSFGTESNTMTSTVPFTPRHATSDFNSMFSRTTSAATTPASVFKSHSFESRWKTDLSGHSGSSDNVSAGASARKIRHVTAADLENSEVPSYLTCQLGSVVEINSQIDTVNGFLEKSDAISRSQFSDLIPNEKPLILLLTKWLKLMKSEWRQGETTYFLG